MTKGDLFKQAQEPTALMEICGPFKETTFSDKLCLLAMATLPNRYVCARRSYKNKSETHNPCPNRISWLKRYIRMTVKHICCENAKHLITVKAA